MNETNDESTPTPEPAVIDLPAGILEQRGEDLVWATAKPIAQDVTQAREMVGRIRQIAREKGHKVRLVVDLRNMRSMSRDVRLLYQSDENAASLIGVALLIDSGISRVLGNFIMGLDKGELVTRLFTTEQDAIAWLDRLADD